ncbi:hypothetical protein ACIGFL_09530 [Pseudomonas sp. NPDC077649]|uniref:hypothetical protein n=1 Tax=Pseudomonas sp. NPDC077649 TaxID=3364423 RepID=UPI0037C798F2
MNDQPISPLQSLSHFTEHRFEQLAVFEDGRTPLYLTEQQYNAIRDLVVLAGAEPDCDRSACGDYSPGPCDNPDCPARRDKPAPAVQQISTAAKPQVYVPDGYALVPITPTPEMMQAALDKPCFYPNGDLLPWSQITRAAYFAMLDAAPPVKAELTAVRCQCCQAEHLADSYDAGFIAGSGMCQSCDAAIPAKDIHTPAARDVLAERQRQITAEGWTPDHDAEHDGGELAAAGAAYALHAADHLHPYSQGDGGDEAPDCWPWHNEVAGRGEGPVRTEPAWWKPGAPRRNLIKAGALILAEIERLDSAEQGKQQEQQP